MSAPHLIREKIETGSLDHELGAFLRNPLYADKTAAEILEIYIEQRDYIVGSVKTVPWAFGVWVTILASYVAASFIL